MSKPEELELAKEVARKAKILAQERQDKMLATVRAEFYVQLSEVLKAGVVKAATWHVGEATPPADFGRAGDLYLDITTADVLFNNAGEWQVVLNVRPKDGEDGKDAEPVDYSRIESKISELTKEEASKIKPEKVNYEKVNSSIKEEVSKLKPEKVNYDKVTSEIKEEVKKEVSRIPKPKDGKDGSKWYAEKGKPTYTIGKKGDLYIDSNTGDFYQKTSDLLWVRKGSLKGESVAGGFIVTGGSEGGGGSGTDGREVELQTSATHIQWRYVGEASWTNLIALTELQGEQGIQGVAGTNGTNGANGAMPDPGANGIMVRTALNTDTARTITGTTNQVNVSNGDGVSGNPVISLPQNIHTGATPTFAGQTINGDLIEGVYLNPTAPNTNTAPQRISRVKQNGRAIIDAVGAFSGFGNYFYCADRNPVYTITTTGVTGVSGMFDNDLSGGANIPVANLATTPAVIEIVRADGGRINFTDVITLIIVHHRLQSDETLTSYKVETKGSDGVWRTELDRTGVTDIVSGAISIPLHVTGNTYAAGDPPPPSNAYHACHGIRLTIRGATAPSWNSGNFRIAELQLRDSRPMYTPAQAMGALDVRGGEMYGDISLPSVSGTRLATSSGQKLAFYGATPIVRPSATPANATDLATALTLINDLKTKLIALGLIS